MSVTLLKIVPISEFVYHVNECAQCMHAWKPALLCTLGRSLDVAMVRTESHRLTDPE